MASARSARHRELGSAPEHETAPPTRQTVPLVSRRRAEPSERRRPRGPRSRDEPPGEGTRSQGRGWGREAQSPNCAVHRRAGLYLWRVRRVTIVVNPVSGSGRRARAAESFADALRRAELVPEVVPTQHPGHAVDIAREAALSGATYVTAAGGDGTVNEVVAGLLAAPEARADLAVLPLGTSNLVARHLRLPFDAAAAADAVASGQTRPFDVGMAGDSPFVACVGIGWDARVVERVTEARKGHIRPWTYVVPGLSAFLGYDFPRLRVTDEHGRTANGVQVLFMNCRPYARFFAPVPEARCDDGLLDAVVLDAGGRWRLPEWVLRSWNGTLGRGGGATAMRGTRFRVEPIDASRPPPSEVDGDVGPPLPLDVRVRPAALRIACPTASP